MGFCVILLHFDQITKGVRLIDIKLTSFSQNTRRTIKNLLQKGGNCGRKRIQIHAKIFSKVDRCLIEKCVQTVTNKTLVTNQVSQSQAEKLCRSANYRNQNVQSTKKNKNSTSKAEFEDESTLLYNHAEFRDHGRCW